jgi:hypothetical protein
VFVGGRRITTSVCVCCCCCWIFVYKYKHHLILTLFVWHNARVRKQHTRLENRTTAPITIRLNRLAAVDRSFILVVKP